MATGVVHPLHQLHHGPKRKSSAAGLPGTGRPVKRRASKACHCCRSRKVRCDVVESGIPCTNCRLDEVECVVTEGKRRKKPYAEGDCLHHSPIESIEEKEDVPQFPIFDDIDGLHDIPVPVKALAQAHPKTDSFEYELSHHRPHMIYQIQGHRLTSEERTHRLSALGQPPKLSISPPTRFDRQLAPYTPVSSHLEINLPRYISSVPKQIAIEDLEYLQKKGAFIIPEAGIRNELLRSYVQYVHPYLPLLELQELMTIIEKDGSSGTVSLLLFQAVMFAATAYIDMRYLTAMGYVTRKSARKAFFQRVKLLYDFEWEIDRVTVVQSVLLMTYWYESPNDPKDVWHWLGIAISIARTIGLNYNTDDSLLTLPKRRLWKRVWWCCFMRDRLVAIGMRRPVRIKADDYDLSMLTVDDFETDPLPPELCRMLGGCSAVRDGSKRTTLANMCIALVELCKLIGDILGLQYSALGHKVGITSETTVRLVPRKTGAESSEVVKCDRDVERWYNSLPLQLRFFVPGSRERTNNHDGEVISVHRALLTGIYFTATSALHRPQMMPVAPNLSFSPELKELSQRRVREAALDITEIFRDLYAHDLIRYLPNTGVTAILPAIIVHLMDIKSADAIDRQSSMRHFQFCMQALQKLREVYSSADFAFSFLEAATRKVEINGADTTFGGSRIIPTFQTRPSKKSVALTPPPDHQGAHSKVRQNSNSSIRSKSQPLLYTALTPPSSEQSLSSSITNDAAASFGDLEHLIDFDGMFGIDEDPFSPFSFDTINAAMPPIEVHGASISTLSHNSSSSGSSNDSAGPGSSSPGQVRLSNALIGGVDQHSEGASDLFVPTKINMDDNLFKDIDMEWLADPENDEEDVDEDDGSYHDHGRGSNKIDGPKQLRTPESDTSRTEPGKPDHVEKMAELEMERTIEGFPVTGDLDIDLDITDA